MVKWLHDLYILDNEIINLKLNINIPREFLKMRIETTSASILSFSTAIFIFVVDILCFYPTSFDKFFSNVNYCVPTLAANVMFLKFFCLLLVLRRRYQWINKGISDWKDRFNDGHNTGIYETDIFLIKKFQAVYFNEKHLAMLDNLRMKHFRLHTLTDELLQMFSSPLLFSFLQMFISFQVYTLYFIKLPTTQFAQKTTSLYQFFGKGNIVIAGIQLVFLGVAGSLISVEVKYFICQLFHNKVEITAYNIFVIRISLIFQVASSLTSYLVLCIQLHI
ncbi:unnamed protein product [Psylliodes chrysocephalus]|uniref:Gustatory receptor n=1 Tax=Psylliodes chrysocephalus TaxID=3402493 RepID=A0A9P0CL23_9CUCU|nr:unnamed protein product [Psylliodes chrysocephala]